MLDSIKHKFTKFIHLFREGSFHDIARLTSNYLPNWLLLIDQAYLLTYSEGKFILRRRPKKYTFRQVFYPDLQYILECSDENQTSDLEKLFSDYFSQDRKCYAVEYDGKIVGYCWAFFDTYILSYDGYKRSNITLEIDSDTVFLGDGYINPKYRLRGFFSLLLSEVYDVVQEKYHKKKIFALIGAFNKHSLLSHKKLGFKQILSYNYYYFVGISLLKACGSSDGRANSYRFGNKQTIKLQNL